ncbi:MAG: hypothetical protein V9G98_10815 [Candidatus Competibacter sp.]
MDPRLFPSPARDRLSVWLTKRCIIERTGLGKIDHLAGGFGFIGASHWLHARCRHGGQLDRCLGRQWTIC